jgi:hypothetical protein
MKTLNQINNIFRKRLGTGVEGLVKRAMTGFGKFTGHSKKEVTAFNLSMHFECAGMALRYGNRVDYSGKKRSKVISKLAYVGGTPRIANGERSTFRTIWTCRL